MSLPVINQHIYSILQPNHAKSIHIDLFLQDISFLPRATWTNPSPAQGTAGLETLRVVEDQALKKNR